MEGVELRLLNQDLVDIAIIDTYVSLSWSDKYNEYGSFEIVLPLTQENINLFQKDYYIWKNDTIHLMIIETIEIDESNTSANKFKISGRSLESILDRRIVWTKTTFSNGNFQNNIKSLINSNIISPSDTNRKINNFIFEDSTDTNITSLTYSGEYNGDDLYSVISTMCSEKKVGFKITLNSINQFVFKLYLGVDRSTEQTTNMPVVFSDEYDNLFNSSYIESYADYKNTCLFHGSNGTGSSGTSSGLFRREMYDSDTDITSTDSNVLNQKAAEALDKLNMDSAVDGDLDNRGMYIYRRDYDIGDWITFRNKWGKESKARISEMLLSADNKGTKYSPTFSTKKKEES